MRVGFSLLMILVFVNLAALEAFAQSKEWIDPLSPPYDLIVKGSENPELIPLSHCYNVFFRTLAREAANGGEGWARAQALLVKTGLKRESVPILINAAAEYEGEVAKIESEAEVQKGLYRAQPLAETAAKLRSLDDQKQALALRRASVAIELVGFVEAQKVHRYIEQFVRRQVTLGGADAAHAMNSRCATCPSGK